MVEIYIWTDKKDFAWLQSQTIKCFTVECWMGLYNCNYCRLFLSKSTQTHIHPQSAAAGGSPAMIACHFLNGETGDNQWKLDSAREWVEKFYVFCFHILMQASFQILGMSRVWICGLAIRQATTIKEFKVGGRWKRLRQLQDSALSASSSKRPRQDTQTLPAL